MSTGIAGLDMILGEGLMPNRLYLVEGTPGAGKTTLALQFLLEGKQAGEKGLYIALSETAEELRAGAQSHGWSLDGVSIFELAGELGLDPESEQSILHPSEMELGETIREVMAHVEAMEPSRVVFDSLSELRLLAQNPLRYRRQILALKQFFARRRCTVLMLDDRASETTDLQLHSIAHGVISLEQLPRDFGPERRRMRIVKMRGLKYSGGYHDFKLDTGGLTVFPRLVAADHHSDFVLTARSTGEAGLDALLGGGLTPGTNTLLCGPSGVGKTTTAVRCMMAALQRGERATYYLFDEGLGTFMARSAALRMDLEPYIRSGKLEIRPIDPAEISSGEFAWQIRQAVERDRATFLVVDSLNAYLKSMPGEQHLLLQLHEMLTYLGQQGVTSMLILGQHGVLGDVRSEIDLSYLSDNIVMFRLFEACGEVRTAISVIKCRTNAHDRSICEFRLNPEGLGLGEALRDYSGILAGVPTHQPAASAPDDPAATGRS
jgi:circadian clock protein KaiC